MEVTWVVVAESSRARIFALRGLATPLQELEDLVNPAARIPEHSLVSDRPGRTVDSAGRRHATQSAVSPREHLAQSFAHLVAGRLEQGRTQGAFEHLIIAAAPEFLGLLRNSLSEATRHRVRKEIHKNLVREDEQAVREHLQF